MQPEAQAVGDRESLKRVCTRQPAADPHGGMRCVGMGETDFCRATSWHIPRRRRYSYTVVGARNHHRA
eukprot:5449256-Prymnesium_polylepis.1